METNRANEAPESANRPEESGAGSLAAELTERGAAASQLDDNQGESIGTGARYGGRDSGKAPAASAREETQGNNAPYPDHSVQARADREASLLEGDQTDPARISARGRNANWQEGQHPSGTEHAGHGGGALGEAGAGLSSSGQSDVVIGSGTTGNNAGNG